MKVHLKKPQRWVAFIVAALAAVISAAACNKIFGESELSHWWLIPAIGSSLLVVVFGYFLATAIPATEASAGNLRAGTMSVSVGAAAVLAFGAASVALYMLDEPPGAAVTTALDQKPSTSASRWISECVIACCGEASNISRGNSMAKLATSATDASSEMPTSP